MWLCDEKKKNYRYIFILAVFSLIFSCSPESEFKDDDDDDYDREYSSRRPSGSSLRVVDEGAGRFQRLKSSQFKGEDCDEKRECLDQCRDIYNHNSFRSQCGNLPEDMVAVLYENFQNLQHIRVNSDRLVDPSALGALLHLEPKVMVQLVEDSWTERDISEFLNWAAGSELVIEALEEDDRNVFLTHILKRLNSNTSSALLASIDRYRDTFISQAAKADNEKAVRLAVQLISSDSNELGSFFCKRERIRSTRGGSSSSCHYHLAGQNRRRDYCYIHGPTVWSYINDVNFAGVRFPANLLQSGSSSRLNLDENSCESFCSRHDNCETPL